MNGPGPNFSFSALGGVGIAAGQDELTDRIRTATLHASEFARELRESPYWYPLTLELPKDSVQFLALPKARYVAASFLDSRMLQPADTPISRPWDEIRQAAGDLPTRCHFIFHISHVGSTLLSRLVGEHAALFSLREPAVLRTLAETHAELGRPGFFWSPPQWDERLQVSLALWSRTFDAQQTAVIKATSFVSELASDLLSRVGGSRAVFMYVAPRVFLKALLGGAMSDMTSKAEKRLARLHHHVGQVYWRSDELSPGECVAMSWLCEMAALRRAADQFPSRILWIDFDRFLISPQTDLAAALSHFHVPHPDAEAARILSGPLMNLYAKAPAYRFDAQVRERLLHEAELKHAAEIGKGLDWLDRAAAAIPSVGVLLDWLDQAKS